MKTILWNILAVIVGWFAGCVVNMAIISAGPFVVPMPPGADVSTMEGLREAMSKFSPLNFLCPWLAHGLGTFVGAWVAAKMAASGKLICALVVGALFLLGGITMVLLVGGPLWFIAADLLLAYLPMAWLGAKLAGTTPAKSAPKLGAVG
jgi:hypothetical protein